MNKLAPNEANWGGGTLVSGQWWGGGGGGGRGSLTLEGGYGVDALPGRPLMCSLGLEVPGGGEPPRRRRGENVRESAAGTVEQAECPIFRKKTKNEIVKESVTAYYYHR